MSKINEALKQALKSQGIRLLRSDNICIGGKIPLPDGTVGIICEEENSGKGENQQ